MHRLHPDVVEGLFWRPRGVASERLSRLSLGSIMAEKASSVTIILSSGGRRSLPILTVNMRSTSARRVYFLFGSDGGGEGYGFDTQTRGMPIVRIPFIGMERRYATPVAENFPHLFAKHGLE